MAKVKIYSEELFEDEDTGYLYRQCLDGTYELVKVDKTALVADIDFNTVQVYTLSGTGITGAAATRFTFPANVTVDTLDIQIAPDTAVLSGSLPVDIWVMLGINYDTAAGAYSQMNSGVIPNTPTALSPGIKMVHVKQGEKIHLPYSETIRTVDICSAKTSSAAVTNLAVVMEGYARV